MTSSYRKTKKPTFGRNEHHVFADRCKQPVDDFRRGDGLPLAFNRSPRLRLTERILRKFQLGSRDKFGRKRKQSLRVTLAPLDLARETLMTALDAGRVCLCCKKGNVRRHTQLRKDAHVGSHCDGGFATLGRTERRARNAKLARKAQRCQSAGTAHRRQPLAELAQQFTGRRGIKFDRSRHAVQLFNRSTFNARDSAPLPGPSRSSGLVPSRRRWGTARPRLEARSQLELSSEWLDNANVPSLSRGSSALDLAWPSHLAYPGLQVELELRLSEFAAAALACEIVCFVLGRAAHSFEIGQATFGPRGHRGVVPEPARLRRPTVQGDRYRTADGAIRWLGSTDASVQARSRFTAARSAACEFAQNLIERPKLHCAEASFPFTLDRPDRLALDACDFPALRCE